MLALAQLGRVVGGEDLRDRGAVGEGAREGVDPVGAQPLDLARARSRLGRARRGLPAALTHRACRRLTGRSRRSPARHPCSRCSVVASRSISRIAGPWWVSCSIASRQPERRFRDQAADHAEAVLAAVAGDRDPRLALDLGRALEDRRVGDVGKVGDDQVDLLARARSGRPSATITSSARPSRSAFSRAASAASGERSEAVTRRSGRSRDQGQGDRPGAGADLVHARALGQLDGDLDQQLGLPPRQQHARVDGDLDLAEAGAAEDVGQRLVVGAARTRSSIAARQLRRQLAGAVAGQLLGADAERVGDQRLRVGARLLASGGGDRLGGRVDCRAPTVSGSAERLGVRCARVPSGRRGYRSGAPRRGPGRSSRPEVRSRRAPSQRPSGRGGGSPPGPRRAERSP